MAEPVQCLSGTGNCELSNSVFVNSDDSSDFVLDDESVMPVSSSLRPAMAQTDGTELCTSTVSSTTADSTDPDSSTLPAITSTVCCIVFLWTCRMSNVTMPRHSSIATECLLEIKV